MFVDPSMGGRIYNPWMAKSNILQRFGDVNPSPTINQPPQQQQTNETSYRFFGGGQQAQGNKEHQIYRSFF